MKLWLLRPIEGLENDPWEPWYDKVFGFVIRAETEERAREIANENGRDETCKFNARIYREGRDPIYLTLPDPWLDSTLSTCDELFARNPDHRRPFYLLQQI
jgi:hypothetical protein